MRFETKFDRWIVVLLVVAGIGAGVILPAVRFASARASGGSPWFTFLPLGIWLIALACTLPQYYEVRENGLYVRQGWRKNLITYASLMEVRPHSDSRSAAVFSTDRILLVTDAGKRYLIAVAEDERFLREVAKRSPQLEQKDSGLGIPFSAPSIG